LLATPITTTELVLAKVIAAIAPAVAATWLAYGIYMVGAWFMVETAVFQQLLDPTWLLAIFVVSPLLTALSANAALSISSRVSDPRVAEQLSALVVLPIILLVVGQSTGLLLVNRRLIFIIGLVVLLLDTAVFFLSIKIFERETILTRWK
jgi:ABC-2 type transport system permease protein